MTRLVVHVDRVVLHGSTVLDRASLERALQAELQRQLAEPGTLERWTRLESRTQLRLPPLHADASVAAPSAGLGAALAGHLAREVG